MEELAQAEARLQQLLSGLEGAEVAVPLGAFRGSLPWPVEGRVRAGFGRRKHPRFDTYTVHNGLEIDAPPDAEVRAVHEGRVVFADRFRGYGLMVVVDHGAKHHSLYAQLARSRSRRGRRWRRGRCWARPTPAGADGPGRLLRDALPGPAGGPPGLAAPALRAAGTTRPGGGILIS